MCILGVFWEYPGHPGIILFTLTVSVSRDRVYVTADRLVILNKNIAQS